MIINSDLLSKIINSGFILLIVREMFKGIRGALQTRKIELELVESFNLELQVNSDRIGYFYRGIEEMIKKNGGKPGQYIPDLLHPVNYVSETSASKLFSVFGKYSPGTISDMVTFSTYCKNYDFLLEMYQKLFMGVPTFSYSNDPHKDLKKKADFLKLGNIGECENKLSQGIERVRQGGYVWKTLKHPLFYWPLRIIGFLLLTFLPEREAL